MDKNSPSNDLVAIVGIGCRFPGAGGPEEFWNLLRQGTDAVRKVPAERRELFDSDVTRGEATATHWGTFLDDIEGFDWRAFSISPREARFMDPQQRLLLEVSWEALEDAGIPVDGLHGSSTGVFVGIMWNDYAKLQMTRLDGYSVSGGSLAFAANRISHFFDLNGPSMSIDVSCASSLVAFHLACQSICTGESDMAIAGGVNLMIAPDTTLAIVQAGILSPQGRCKTFDADADGFVRGEGAGVVLLKPLSRALADGNRVYATVRATAVLHSGRTESIMAPSVPVQERMLRSAYARAGVDPADVDFVELHGTGTRKGDPIEARALGAVVGATRDARRPCIVGSVKTNIGHVESAAGIAGLIKTALAIHHREIPPSLHLQKLNPEINLADLRLEYASSLRPWPQTGRLPLAGVTGLSFGGGNVHVVLEGMPQAAASDVERPRPAILPISARTPPALRELAGRYRQLLDEQPTAAVGMLCASAARGRAHHAWRTAVVGATRAALAAKLDAFLGRAPTSDTNRRSSHPPRVTFVFSGAGAEWSGMGRELLRQEPIFREEMERCDLAVRRHASWSLIEQLCSDSPSIPSTERLQPTLWALHAALAFLWRSWGLAPAATVGHGVGEIAAAFVAGALSREDAARIAVVRGCLLQHATTGPLLELALPENEAARVVSESGGRASIAAYDGPNKTVLLGEGSALRDIAGGLESRGVASRILDVNHACDAVQLRQLADQFANALGSVTASQPSLRFISTVTGKPWSGHDCGAAYWGRQLHEPIRFFPAIDQLGSEDYDVFVELGPHPILTEVLRECLGARNENATVVSSLRRAEGEREAMLASLAELYERGCNIDWRAVSGEGRHVPLPLYPWQKERLWLL